MSKKITMKKEFVEGDEVILSNVSVKWANLNAPDDRFEPCWKVDAVLTQEMADEMKKVGFKVRQDNDGDWILRCKKKTHTKKGKPMDAPKVVGRDGKTAFTENIGNGSIMNIRIFAKYVEVNGNTYLPARLNAAQVVTHVPYEGGGGFDNLDESEEPADF
jgi:hypothetical protein